jgi:hypothetical protein
MRVVDMAEIQWKGYLKHGSDTYVALGTLGLGQTIANV